MNSADVKEITPCDSEDKNLSKDNCTGLEVGAADSLAKSVRLEPCSSFDHINNTENIEDAGTLSANKNNENFAKQADPKGFTENSENSPKCDVNNEFSDVQEEEIKLSWDDDENSEVIEEIAPIPTIIEALCGNIGEAFDKNKTIDIVETDNNDKELIKTQDISEASSSITLQSDSFVGSPEFTKREHGINKPDVMLEIPGMLPDMDDELDNMNVEIFSDNERDLNPEDTEESLSELVSKVNANILSSLNESELDSKLEMSSDDDTLVSPCPANKTNLEVAIENEMVLLSETISSIDEQDDIAVKPADLADITIEPAIEDSNLMTAIQQEVKSLAETMSNIEQDDPMDDVPNTISEISLVTAGIGEEIKVLELQATPTEKRENNMKIKVSTIISSIEKEMQLLDSNDEMEISVPCSDSSKFKEQDVAEAIKELNTSKLVGFKDKKISSEVKEDIDVMEEISLLSEKEPKNKESETEPKTKELDESELRQKELDELALAVKAIEPENQIYESAPAVTLLNVNPVDELSEISVIDEDDQPSISIGLDDDIESIEVLHQNAGPISAIIDESEVSVIQDSDDDELPILRSDADDILTESNAENAFKPAEIHETNNEIKEKSAETERVETEITTVSSLSIAMKETDNSNMPAPDDNKMDDVISSEVEKDVDLIDSTMSIKDATVKENLENANIELPQVSQGAAETEKVEPEITTVCSLSVAIKETDNGNLPAPDDNKMDNDMSSEVEKDVDLIDSSMSIKLPQLSQGVNNKTNDDTTFTPEQDKDILATEHNDKLLVKVTDDFLPQPSTSTVDFDMKDSSNDVPDSDTLGLLAESTRVMDDDDDQDDDDDDDDDFYQDDESNLMTAEHSEDSNPQSDDANEAQDVETEEKETTKQTEIESTDVSMAGDQDDNEQELLTPEQRGEEFQFTISNVTNDEQKENETSEAMETDVELEAKTVDPNESNMDVGNDPETTDLKKSNSEPVKKPDTSETVEKPAEPDKSPSVPAEKESKSPSKMLNLSISSQQSVWNFVDLEESSEDEIQIVPKPSETPATTKQAEPQPALDQSTAEKQPEKQTPPKQPDATPTPVSEEAEGADVDMNVEILDTEILNLDDAKDAKEDTTEKTSTDEPDAKSEPSSQQIAEEVGGLEVFTLDSDDEDTATTTTAAEAPASRPGPEPVKRDFKCVNSGCQYAAGAARRAADAATLAYYNADRRRRALVCEDCLRPVLARSQDLMEGIRNLTPLLELEMTTLGLDLVEISDSDSEGEADPEDQEKEKIGDVTAKFLEENLADMINETWVKYQMDSRLSETESVLQMELRRLEVESKDIQSLMRECQATTDRIRTELYASFPQEIMQAPPLIIYDTPDQQYCYVQATLPPKDAETPAPVPTRMSKRRLEAAAAADSPAKRPAIPLGYTPLDTVEQTENKTPGTGAAVDEKIDDDNTEVSVVNIISSEAAPPGLPPPGELVRPPYKIGMTVFGVRSSFGTWGKGKVLEIMPKGTHSLSYTACKVKFEQRSSKPVKIVLARSMAFPEPANARLTIGTRVIANFKDTKDNKALSQDSKREAFFPGIVAEVPNPVNKYRYLIFFDDGYAQYVNHEDCRLICECASLVWEEVHPYSRDFVREYLLAYPERPMVRLHPSQSLKTEWNGKWWTSRVVTVDASLAQVYTPANERYEWIYRGSTRLAPLYLELQAAERHRARPMPRAQAHARTNMPVVEYTRYDEQTNKTFEVEKTPIQRQLAESIRQRAVAKKSTGGVSAQPAPPGAPPRLPPGQNLDNVTSRVVYYTPKNAVRPHKLVPHTCGPKCKRTDVLSLKDLRTYNPLAKPLLSGWERQIVRYKGQKVVAYRAPCGRRVRTAPELHRYLRATRAELPVDLFDFSPATHCLAEFVLNKCLIMKKDLSQGKENVPVPCVNYYDDSLPEFCLYNTERTPTAGVPLNLDPEFLCGCDCEDDCEDKSKCACWKLTLEGARTIGLRGDNVGYEYKRLPEPLPSGIYECNSRCKCKHTCLNRVAQHPLQLKLQIFKTLNRGWGIRALNDVPKGSFLCVYAGNLLTDATANLDGLNEGDEYLAELDYIEVVEQMKEGYEDDIPKDLKKITLDGKEESDEDSEQEESSEEESEQTSKTELEDDDFQPAPHYGIRVTKFSKRLRERKRNKDRKTIDDKKEGDKEKDQGKEEPRKEGERGSEEDCITISDDDDVREPSSFAAAAGMGANAFVSKYRSVRSLFGEDESCYIMDAKVQGNIGRYLNHSCSPNVFVQNVFVDTHDPRFPWVAFFALSHVRAGTELTWNYNYDVGSVPGKALYCYCGAPNCRGRLL